jgi:hypothetical protein
MSLGGGREFGCDFRSDSTTGIEMAGYGHVAGLAGGHQIIEDGVDGVLVKNPSIAKAEEIIFQAFEFDHMLIRHVMDHDCGEVWLAGFGANSRKFRARVFDFVIAVGELVGECFEFEHRGEPSLDQEEMGGCDLRSVLSLFGANASMTESLP